MYEPHPGPPGRLPYWPALRPVDWLILCCGVLVTAFLSVGAHDLALTRLGIPYPDDHAPVWVKYASQFTRYAATWVFCRWAADTLDRMRLVPAALLVGVLIAGLNETVRVIAIDWAIYDGATGLNGVYVLTHYLPGGVTCFYQGATAVVIARHGGREAGLRTLAALVIASLIGTFALLPLLKAAMTALQVMLHVKAPPALYDLPFPLYIYKFIYVGYLEPTIAALVMAMLAWPGLGDRPSHRVGAFALLILFLLGRIVSELLTVYWVPQPLPIAFAAEGQFFAESLILGVLTGVAWERVYASYRLGIYS